MKGKYKTCSTTGLKILDVEKDPNALERIDKIIFELYGENHSSLSRVKE